MEIRNKETGCRFCGKHVKDLHRPSVRQKHEDTPGCKVEQNQVAARERGLAPVSMWQSGFTWFEDRCTAAAWPHGGILESIEDFHRPGVYGNRATTRKSLWAPKWLLEIVPEMRALGRALQRAAHPQPTEPGNSDNAMLDRLVERFIKRLMQDEDYRLMVHTVALLSLQTEWEAHADRMLKFILDNAKEQHDGDQREEASKHGEVHGVRG